MPVRQQTDRIRAHLTQQGQQSRTWYEIRNYAGSTAEVILYGEIGFWGTSAEDFQRELRGITAPEITLRVNSPGGEIFDGIAIHNALRSHPANVTTYVDSLAASIASVIALAGDRVVMMPHSQLMIHDGSGLAIGNAADMREMADLLDRQSDNLAAVYAERAGGTVEEWRERMRAETWMTAAEAVEFGLADEVDPGRPQPEEERPAAPAPATASWDLKEFGYRYAGRDEAPAPGEQPTAPETPETAASIEQPVVAPVAAVFQDETFAAALREFITNVVTPGSEQGTTEPAAEPAEPAPAADEPPGDTETRATTGEDTPPDTTVPDTDWATLTAQLTTPADPGDDQFRRLTEALL